MQPERGLEKSPLYLLLSTVEGILYPTFVNTLMLDFLRLMTMVEFHRLRATEQAQDMNEWHVYYEAEDTTEPEVRFEETDLANLRQFIADDPDLRPCFIQMLAQSCREVSLHIRLS